MKKKSIETILIANRGEIAARIIRTCRKMGIQSIAVYSDPDRDLPFVRMADSAIALGGSQPAASYLDMDKIFHAAHMAGADAIHPGYGFLSENADFADKCAENGFVFIGPNPDAIRAMGSKSEAKSIMEAQGVPLVPGYKGQDQSLATFLAEAEKIGYPVLLKAVAGGGGKGMRCVQDASQMEAAIAAAKSEAQNAFGEDQLILEKYIDAGRHIEIQIMGDAYGNILHLLERECSLQRRYQKVMEESPSPVIDDSLRNRMGEAAIKAAKALNYDNAGTVEFIFDAQSGEFYFLEVNTRLQVEHPVTEAITGLDLVQMQIECAAGIPLSLSQEEIQSEGYALELRLYAEDVVDFTPQSGQITRFEWPEVEGLRMETAIESGSEISVFYDPMIAKIIMHGKNRADAHRKMRFVLDRIICQGTLTNLPFLQGLMRNESVFEGEYDTNFISKTGLENIVGDAIAEKSLHLALIAASLMGWHERQTKRKLLAGLPSRWRNNYYGPQKRYWRYAEEEIEVTYRYENEQFQFEAGEHIYTIHHVKADAQSVAFEYMGMRFHYDYSQSGTNIHLHHPKTGNLTLAIIDKLAPVESEAAAGGYVAPMPAQIVKVCVENGQKVRRGDALVVISSMKMENTIAADADGVVKEIFVQAGENVPAGHALLEFTQNEN